MSGLMTVSELARAVAALQTHGGGRIAFSSVSTDTRTLAPGALFVALRGERFDGHEYVPAARERGAAVALVERVVDVELPQVVVADSKRAKLVRKAEVLPAYYFPKEDVRTDLFTASALKSECAR